jgi:hypothetical protein
MTLPEDLREQAVESGILLLRSLMVSASGKPLIASSTVPGRDEEKKEVGEEVYRPRSSCCQPQMETFSASNNQTMIGGDKCGCLCVNVAGTID